MQFRTTPTDSTGVPHVLEHTVLCGSQKYPCRDPFFKMLNRSLSTFMNAFTGRRASSPGARWGFSGMGCRRSPVGEHGVACWAQRRGDWGLEANQDGSAGAGVVGWAPQVASSVLSWGVDRNRLWRGVGGGSRAAAALRAGAECCRPCRGDRGCGLPQMAVSWPEVTARPTPPRRTKLGPELGRGTAPAC